MLLILLLLLLLPIIINHCQVLDPAWFKGADVLDVGCNEGLVTLALAVHCGCHSVCGVDIDPVLVAKACTNLSRSRSQLNQQLHTAIRERYVASQVGVSVRGRGIQAQGTALQHHGSTQQLPPGMHFHSINTQNISPRTCLVVANSCNV